MGVDTGKKKKKKNLNHLTKIEFDNNLLPPMKEFDEICCPRILWNTIHFDSTPMRSSTLQGP
jgi:hypothetical protein